MRWKSDSEVWNGYGTGMVRSCKISPLIFLIRATPGTWSVPYLWNGRRFHTFWRVWNGPGSIPMERAWFHTLVPMNPPGFVPYLLNKFAAIYQWGQSNSHSLETGIPSLGIFRAFKRGLRIMGPNVRDICFSALIFF